MIGGGRGETVDGTHVTCPMELDRNAPDYPGLYARRHEVMQGENIEEFHRTLLAHQHRCAQAGMYSGTESAINNRLDLARVTSEGAIVTSF